MKRLEREPECVICKCELENGQCPNECSQELEKPYIIEREWESRRRYVDFVFRTGMTVGQLEKLHEDAVKAIDKKQQGDGLVVHVTVKPEVVAYLTDLALRHLRGQHD